MKKVCILGAGPAGLAAAYGLSATPELRAAYDVHVYQVGARAGGKCSTGRAQPGDHVNQNCAHYLFGCYDNTFHMVRELYGELDGAGLEGFDDFDSTLLPRNLVALKQRFQGEWHTWMLEFPANSARPGDVDGEFLSAGQYFVMVLEWILEGIFGWELIDKINDYRWEHRERGRPSGWSPDRGVLGRLGHRAGGVLLRGILALVRRRKDGSNWFDGALSLSLKALRALVWRIERAHVADDLESQRTWMLFDYGCSALIGVLDDAVLSPGGFERIDDQDFREWLRGHGATQWAVDSPFVSLWYQNSLAYVDGDVRHPRMSAGMFLLGQMFAANNYKGSVAFSLEREVGDTFIAPIYQALEQRGVHFHFFHRVRDVVADEDGNLASVHIEQQVRLKDGESDGYRPLTPIQGWQCWPERPDSTQFCDADRERFDAGDYDLDSFYTTWRSSWPELVLERGRDFDAVVYAMPHSTLPFSAKSTYEREASWQRMVEHNPTTESRSLRLWFRSDLAGIGWDGPPPILAGYEMPYCTWEDDTQLIGYEGWPAEDRPGAIACVFGPLPAPTFPPGPDDAAYAGAQGGIAETSAQHFISDQAVGIWPKVSEHEHGKGIDPSLLLLTRSRANVGPTERYTMTFPGGLAHRLKVDETGVTGLYFAGDWARNGIEAGSTESAVVAGLQASRAICGHPKRILGEHISYD